MKRVLLALSTSRKSSEAIRYALEKVSREKAELVILFIVDPDIPRFILDKMLDVGFMGDSPSKQVYKSLLDNYRERGKKTAEEISKAAESLGVEWKTIITEGEFVGECLKVIEKYRPELTILTRAERSNLSRFLFGSSVNRLKERSPCPVKVIEED